MNDISPQFAISLDKYKGTQLMVYNEIQKEYFF